MAHSSFSADPFYPEPDAIGKEEEESSDNKSSEDATVPSPLLSEHERLDLVDPVPEVDQQIAQPISSTESLMDTDGENIRVEDVLRDIPSPPNNTEDPIMETGDTPSPPNNTEDPIMENIEYYPNIADKCMICRKECTGIFLLLCCEVSLCEPCGEYHTRCPDCNERYVM